MLFDGKVFASWAPPASCNLAAEKGEAVGPWKFLDKLEQEGEGDQFARLLRSYAMPRSATSIHDMTKQAQLAMLQVASKILTGELHTVH